MLQFTKHEYAELNTVKLNVSTILTIHHEICKSEFFPLTDNAHQMDIRKVNKAFSPKGKK